MALSPSVPNSLQSDLPVKQLTGLECQCQREIVSKSTMTTFRGTPRGGRPPSRPWVGRSRAGFSEIRPVRFPYLLSLIC